MLKTLEEHNRERLQQNSLREAERQKPKFNGIACPQCGSELCDDNAAPMYSNGFDSYKSIFCNQKQCGFKGKRVL